MQTQTLTPPTTKTSPSTSTATAARPWRSRPAPPPPSAPPVPPQLHAPSVAKSEPSTTQRRPKFNLAGLAPKAPAKTKTAYPTVPDPTGAILSLATDIKTKSAELESLEGDLETAKAQLRNLVEPSYFQIHSGKTDVPSSIAVNTPEGDVLITFSSRYKKIEAIDPIAAAFGDDFIEQHFKESFKITIDGSQIPTVDPANPNRNPAQEFIDDLVALIARHNAGDAVKQESSIAPTKQFHDTRHAILSPDQNRALQQLCPMIVAIKTKGRD